MLIIWPILCILVENARSQKCTSPALGPNCICNQNQNSADWEIKCGDYDAKYINNGNILTIGCQNLAEINEFPSSILTTTIASASDTRANANHTNSTQDPTEVRVDGCTLHNASFADILKGVSVKTLTVHCEPNSTQEWTNRLFKDLKNVQKLSIKFCPTQNKLPEDLFAQNSNLNTLYLENNTLTDLPEKLLNGLNNLKYFSLMGNNLQSLPTSFFNKSVALEEAHLNYNRLTQISFNGLGNLKVLDMSNNNFSQIEDQQFANTPSLISLNLGYNNILKITTLPFQNLSNLWDLDISYNGPDLILPKRFLKGLDNLDMLNITDCHFTNPPPDLLQWVPNLKKLLLGNNRIESIPKGFFSYSNNLVELDLIYNDLKDDIPSDIFQGLTSLTSLNLKRNNFTNYPDKAFHQLPNLQSLHMEENFFTDFQMEGSSLMTLKELYLDKNNITHLNQDLPFGRRTALENVSITQNQLKIFDFNWTPYNKLRMVDFSGNKFPFVVLPYLYSQEDVKFYLNNCSTQAVDTTELADAPPRGPYIGSTMFYLQDNPFVCNCSLLQFKQFINTEPSNFGNTRNYLCSTLRSPKLQPILDVDDRNFICSRVPCPIGCFCSEDANKVTSVDCQNNNFTTLPEFYQLPNNISIAHFENNRLTTINNIQNSEWGNLTELYLDHNQIQANNWLLPKNLLILYLTNNYLTWFPSCLQVFLLHGTTLRLGNNPWVCNCSAYQFFKNITAMNKLDTDSIECTTTDEKSHLKMHVWSQQALCPGTVGFDIGVKVFAPIAAFLGVALLTITLAFTYYHNRRTIYAYLYIHWHKLFLIFFSEKDLDEDRHYHAFVSYSSSDRHIVNKLIEKLEQSDPSYRLCIHERDWLPGNLITWNIVNSVQNSRRTVLILSKDFIKSVWFQLEYNIAYYQMLEDKVDRIIVIVNGELPEKDEMDQHLQVLLSTKTYLSWGERWFWEKLKYALPHHQHNVKNPIPMKERPNHELIKKIEDKIYKYTSESMELAPPSNKDTTPLHDPCIAENIL